MTIRVAIVDDHKLICMAFAHMLADVPGILVVGTAASGEEALSLVRQQQPDVVLLDLDMPGMGGQEAFKRLQRQAPDLRIIVISVTESGPLPGIMLDAGVAGYLTKGSELADVVLAIRRAMIGQRYLSPELAQSIVLTREESGVNPFSVLSEREMQVLTLLTRENRIQDIAESLALSPKTVSTYRTRLMQKLGVENDIGLARLALQHGLLA
ncbi:MAG: response regulator [Moraxellaceae bacterium]|nr:response regulator [Moraxellaceae bacterium]MDZ4297565.1 response regulator [Moraxellaceae bacterium]MDZ4387796.1 response regulator [Moraxellaceae bacterium]